MRSRDLYGPLPDIPIEDTGDRYQVRDEIERETCQRTSRWRRRNAGGSGGGIESGVSPYVVGNGVKTPQVLLKPTHNHTEERRKARAEGSLLIEAVIRKDRSVVNFRILKGLGYGLDESAINTIATKWLFRPDTKNGVPVDIRINVEVTFHFY